MNNTEKQKKLLQQVLNAMERKQAETVAVGIFNRDLDKTDEVDLIIVDEHYYKLLNVKRLIPSSDGATEELSTDWYLLVDMDAYESKSEIQVEVPKGKAGMFAGKKSWQRNKWCKILNARIKIVEAD